MGEVAEMFDVNPSLIRFWEQKFDILKPDKNKKGNRLFTPADVENLKLIYHLVKENGMTLAGAQKRLKADKKGIEQNLEVIEKLQGIKSQLLEVKQVLLRGNPDSEIIIEDDIQAAASTAGMPENRAAPTPTPALSFDMPVETIGGLDTDEPIWEELTPAEEDIIPDTNQLPDDNDIAVPATDTADLPEPVKVEAKDEETQTTNRTAAKQQPVEQAPKKPQIIEQTLF